MPFIKENKNTSNAKLKHSSTNFGEHLCIDGYGGSFEKLNSKKLVLNCLAQLPELLGMKKLCRPHVYFAPDNNIKDCGGWSGFVVIAESHISIHTFPCRGFLSADIYTCKNNMALDFITDYFKKRFELKDIETNFIKRGTRYPVENIHPVRKSCLKEQRDSSLYSE